MSAAGKRWRQGDKGKEDFAFDEDGCVVLRAFLPSTVASVVADHNARLDAEPVAWLVSDDALAKCLTWSGDVAPTETLHAVCLDAQRARAKLAEVTAERDEAIAEAAEMTSVLSKREDVEAFFSDTLKPLRARVADAEVRATAELASMTAERDQAQAEAEHWCKRTFVDASAHPPISWEARATAAEAALAKAKRDAWIAGRDAAKKAAAQSVTDLLDSDYNKNGKYPTVSLTAHYVDRAISALTPPAEAEGGRQAIKSCCDMSDAELAAEDAALEKRWQKFVEDTKDGEGHSGSPGEWIVERSEEVATEQRRRAGRKAEAKRHDR